MIKKISTLSGEALEEVSHIWLNANINAHDFIPESYWLEHLEEVKSMLPQASIYTYMINDKIVGFMGIMDSYIAGIFIDSDYQGQKIGQKLLNEAKEDRKELSLAVYEKNEGAYRFYLREGFKVTEKGNDEENQENELIMIWTK